MCSGGGGADAVSDDSDVESMVEVLAVGAGVIDDGGNIGDEGDMTVVLMVMTVMSCVWRW